jgi:hypothetical protein
MINKKDFNRKIKQEIEYKSQQITNLGEQVLKLQNENWELFKALDCEHVIEVKVNKVKHDDDYSTAKCSKCLVALEVE